MGLERGSLADEDDGATASLTLGQRHKALAMWAIHQAACELAEDDEAKVGSVEAARLTAARQAT